jgi:hypothetical protein
MDCRALGHPLTRQNGLAILPLLCSALLASRLSLEDMALSRRVLQLVLEQPAVSSQPSPLAPSRFRSHWVCVPVPCCVRVDHAPGRSVMGAAPDWLVPLPRA